MPARTAEWFGGFPELEPLDLTKVRLYDGSRWLPCSVAAITLSLPLISWLFGVTRIYLNAPSQAQDSALDLSSSQGMKLLAEELYHAKQQIDRGATSFYGAYLWEYFRHRRLGLTKFAAYNAISFEQEAKDFARRVDHLRADSEA